MVGGTLGVIIMLLLFAHVVRNVVVNVVVNVVRKQFATLEIHVVGPGPTRRRQEEPGPVRRKETGQEEPGPVRQKKAGREEMVRTDDERGKRRSSSVLPFDMMGSDERRSPTGPPFIAFRLLSEGGLGAPGMEAEGFAGFGAPSPDRRPVEDSAGLIELSMFRTHNPICLEN